MSAEERLECCECASSVGADGPQRAALLLPCQHVLHMSCVEYIRRRSKMRRLLPELVESTTILTCSTSTQEDYGSSDAFACPGCHHRVDMVIPLFAASALDGQPATAAEDASREFELTHKAQKKSLHTLRLLVEQRQHVSELGYQCAALHDQRAGRLRDLEKYNTVFSTTANSITTSQVGRGALPVDDMTATELEGYIRHTTPALNGLLASLRKERQLLEKRRQRLRAIKSSYHTKRHIAALDGRIAAALAPDRSPSVRGAAVHQPDADVAPQLPKRVRVNVIDVDEETAAEEEHNVVDEGTLSSAPDLEVIDCDRVEDGDREEESNPEPEPPFLLPCSTVRQDGKPKVCAKYLQLLPRREDRLWQSSLQF